MENRKATSLDETSETCTVVDPTPTQNDKSQTKGSHDSDHERSKRGQGDDQRSEVLSLPSLDEHFEEFNRCKSEMRHLCMFSKSYLRFSNYDFSLFRKYV